MNTGIKTHELVVIRVFGAPVEEVWRAWIDPAMVKQWWGPLGFTCPLARMDFLEGGSSLVCMRSPDGQDLYNTWTYRKIVPHERFEYTLKFTDQDGKAFDPAEIGLPAGIPREVYNVNLFRDLGNGQTELTVKEYGYTTEAAAELSRQGLEQCLDKMAAIWQRYGNGNKRRAVYR
jgi:uncharacterized protein YndB with AHSA1/START domain